MKVKNATRLLVSCFGAIVAFAGFEHGIGEILQGNVAPSGLFIRSWPNSALFEVVAGEPALTIVPNLLVSGVLTVLLSLAFLAWAAVFVQRRHSALVLILLSVVLLLVGGGVFPPVLGLIVALVATQIHAPRSGWRGHVPSGVGRVLAAAWPWLFALAVVTWLSLFPGSIILAALWGTESAGNLLPLFMFLAFGSLLLTIVTGLLRDGDAGLPSHRAPAAR